ncbi:hypothetical protein [Vibrio sp. OPT18]|uniref:hypothetical protein n=1 Tax=Vibrio sp. OPT18 TaxID=2778641 RepID=UPI00187E4C6C|nr:hypothetical protein [Vibrio sp. OPT18]MBE8578676.1 hypothetical protein [Vibrio sp. OPT18]
MDIADFLTSYSEEGFTQALRQLLPKGAYWQEAENIELERLLQGMAADFKATHDDLHLGILIAEPEPLFGWKLSDYRRLMKEHDITGEVFDDKERPNLILVALDASQPYQKMLKAFEEIRLPHTSLFWLFDVTESMKPQPVYIGGYQCVLNHIEVGPKPPNPNVYGELRVAPYVTVYERIEIPLR